MPPLIGFGTAIHWICTVMISVQSVYAGMERFGVEVGLASPPNHRYVQKNKVNSERFFPNRLIPSINFFVFVLYVSFYFAFHVIVVAAC